MVGYTHTDTFKPGDFCYVVVYSLTLPTLEESSRERMDFLEGMVNDVDQPPVPKSIYHPLFKFWPERPELIRTISAMVTNDPWETQKAAADPLSLHEEPSRDYLVITPFEHDAYLHRVIQQQARKIRRQEKMGDIQLARIKALERRSGNGSHLATLIPFLNGPKPASPKSGVGQ